MAETEVGLDSIKLSARDSGLTLTLTSTLSLLVPLQLSEGISAARLSSLVESGALWVSKIGGCRLGFDVTVEGDEDRLGSASADMFDAECLLDVVGNCAIWPLLGVHLRRHEPLQVPSPHSSRPPLSIFSVGHQSLPSGLLLPQGIPCAYFRSVHCSFNFQVKKLPERRSQRIRNQGRSQKYYGPSCGVFQDSHLNHQADILIEAAIYALVGIKKHTAGCRVKKRRDSPSLLSIAPAVWNFHYLEAVTTRATSIPLIATVIASLDTAQSPTLRQKAGALLATPSVSDDEYMDRDPQLLSSGGSSENYLPLRKTETKLWSRLLAGIPVLLGTKRRRPKLATPSGLTPEEIQLLEENAVQMHSGADGLVGAMEDDYGIGVGWAAFEGDFQKILSSQESSEESTGLQHELASYDYEASGLYGGDLDLPSGEGDTPCDHDQGYNPHGGTSLQFVRSQRDEGLGPAHCDPEPPYSSWHEKYGFYPAESHETDPRHCYGHAAHARGGDWA